MSKEKLQFKNIQKYKHIYKKEEGRHTGYMVSSKLSLPTFTAISCETKSNHDMFPPTLRHFLCFYFEFSLALCDIYLYSNGRFDNLGFLFYDTRAKCAQYNSLELQHLSDHSEYLNAKGDYQ